MTTKPKAKKYRIRRAAPLGNGTSAAPASDGSAAPKSEAPANAPMTGPMTGQVDSAATVNSETALDAIRREGLTGRQLRMARRVAQKQGIAATSDFDAVLQLRQRGVDPFQRSNILELVVPKLDDTDGQQALAALGAGGDELGRGRVQLPQTIPDKKPNLPSTERAAPSETRAVEIGKIQRDIAKRRRRKLAMLFTRLSFFVFLPTLIVGWYFAKIATPMFATITEFVIQSSESPGGVGGLGDLFSGTSFATQQDSITVESYLTSREVMLLLDEEHGYIAHFSGENIDAIQRLPEGSTNEDAFDLYSDFVTLGYDPTEGILKLEVVAADPETSQLFSEALIGYAEERIDGLTQRVREDMMDGARTSLELAEFKRSEALDELVRIQGEVSLIDPIGESAAMLQIITGLQQQRVEKLLARATLTRAQRPNQGRLDAINAEIGAIDDVIAEQRARMTQTNTNGGSLATKTVELRVAEENYNTRAAMVQQATLSVETAQIEASRQVRYLLLGVAPVSPDKATYPRAFENTVLAFLIFSGLYLMVSLTASILREQVSS